MKPDEQFSHWKQIRAGLYETIAKFDQNQLGFIPFECSRSAAEIMLHIAEAELGWFSYVVTRELGEWPENYTIENFPTRDAIKAGLAEVHRKTEAYLDSLSEADLGAMIATPWGKPLGLNWIIWHVLEHEVHHRGELSLILGLLGKQGLDV